MNKSLQEQLLMCGLNILNLSVFTLVMASDVLQAKPVIYAISAGAHLKVLISFSFLEPSVKHSHRLSVCNTRLPSRVAHEPQGQALSAD